MLHAFLASALLLASRGSVPVDLTSRAESFYHHYIGQRVIVRGQYSARGKIAGYVATGHATVYLVGYSYGDVSEGQQISVTGILHFQPEAHSPDPLMAGVPAHFYFTRDDSSIAPRRRDASNQTLERTQHFVVSFRSMRTRIFKVLGRSSCSR
jgi:hypothetical protein